MSINRKNSPDVSKGPTLLVSTPLRNSCPACAGAGESERCDALRKAAHLTSDRVLVHDAASNTAGQFRLGCLESGLGRILVATFDGELDPLHKIAMPEKTSLDAANHFEANAAAATSLPSEMARWNDGLGPGDAA